MASPKPRPRNRNVTARIIHGHILYVSKRAIEAGKELLIDYRFEKNLETVKCACGARRCRGTINLIE
ncbi:MAG: hypothetical protein U5J83_15050 [Bryobacterales bacterium]|nr:hypothetical protein [Bryobacterales bacterium]